jgi:glycosyltransferase involved in cell wall biosynthesis
VRITFLVKNWGPRGGTEEYVRVIAAELATRGHSIQFAFEGTTAAADADWRRFMSNHVATELPNDARARAHWLDSHLASARPDILYIHNAAFPGDLLEIVSGRAAVVRFVHDFRQVCLRVSKVYPISRRNCVRPLGYGCLLHGCSVGPGRQTGFPVSWNGIGAHLAERDASRRMDRVVVASRFMRGLLERNGFDPERISVLPLFPSGAVPDRPPPISGGSSLLYMGQISRFKGLPLLLEALAEVPEAVTLDVAGHGPLRGECEQMARSRGLGSRVRFHGWLGRDGLAALLRDACAVVVPSIWNEPFGLVGLEAMAAARPVLAFDVGAVGEWLETGETGLLVPEVSAMALAHGIAQTVADPERAAAWGRAGYQRVRSAFTRERHVEGLIPLLEHARRPAEVM